jgi:hypothetical protein
VSTRGNYPPQAQARTNCPDLSARVSETQAIVAKLLSEWATTARSDMPYGQEWVFVPLKHKVKESEAVSFARLKGKDAALAKVLCACPDVDVFLVPVTRHVEGWNDDYYSSKRRPRHDTDSDGCDCSSVSSSEPESSEASNKELKDVLGSGTRSSTPWQDYSFGVETSEADEEATTSSSDEESAQERECGLNDIGEVVKDRTSFSRQWIASDGTVLHLYMYKEGRRCLSNLPLFPADMRPTTSFASEDSHPDSPPIVLSFKRLTLCMVPRNHLLSLAKRQSGVDCVVAVAQMRASASDGLNDEAIAAVDALVEVMSEESAHFRREDMQAVCKLARTAAQQGLQALSKRAVIALFGVLNCEYASKKSNEMLIAMLSEWQLDADVVHAFQQLLIRSFVKDMKWCQQMIRSAPEALKSGLTTALMKAGLPDPPTALLPDKAAQRRDNVTAFLWGDHADLGDVDWDAFKALHAAALLVGLDSPTNTNMYGALRVPELEAAVKAGDAQAVHLVEGRILQLQAAGADAPKLPDGTWEQPNAIVRDWPQVQAFLRGPLETATFSLWPDAYQAQSWIRQYFGYTTTYKRGRKTFGRSHNTPTTFSGEATITATKPQVQVTIKKNKQDLNRRNQRLYSQAAEGQGLQALLPPGTASPAAAVAFVLKDPMWAFQCARCHA